jgi:uncharacterized membrane protein
MKKIYRIGIVTIIIVMMFVIMNPVYAARSTRIPGPVEPLDESTQRIVDIAQKVQTGLAAVALVILVIGCVSFIKYSKIKDSENEELSEDEIERLRRAAFKKIKIALLIFIFIIAANRSLAIVIYGGKI